MAGGVITRSIEGVADEYEPTQQSTLRPFTNYFHSYSQLRKDINNDKDLTNNIENSRYDYAPEMISNPTNMIVTTATNM